ncbi:hypothetical protein LTR60_006403 [Cryomyces antarcticus]|nr:hypothetical protein LTR60_006403 [Cryomyces antarcticus]
MAKSKARMKNRYLERPSTPAVQVEEQSGAQNQFLRRFATLYDVVAGRVSYHGFIPAEPQTSTYRDTAVTTTVPVPPDEALMRREGAPTPTEVDDKYSADAKLGAHQKLPDSDLLKAVHAYASDYYACATKDRGRRDWKSMEETALLAMGILLEEAAAEVLGQTGDLVFVEGEDEDQADHANSWDGARSITSRVEAERSRKRRIAALKSEGKRRRVDNGAGVEGD